MGIDFYGPTSEEFVEAYTAAYDQAPSYHGAGGYAAGLILQKAMEVAGSTDPAAIKTALEGLDIMTFYGHIKFDTSPENHGLQIGHIMINVQWQHDDAGKLVTALVWPLGDKAAETIYPLR
jgi:ABC-type branched-subunit amino acid transport system substrate-binding protein